MQEQGSGLGRDSFKRERIDIEMMLALIKQKKAVACNPGEPRDAIVVIGREYFIKCQSSGYYQRLSYSND